MLEIEVPQILVLTVFFVCAFLFSFLFNRLFLKFSKTLGIRHLDENLIRWGPQTKPSLGGISFFIMFLLSFSFIAVISFEDQYVIDKRLIGFILAVTLGFVVGLADDAYDTNPLLKAFAQFTCANILMSMGIYIEVTPFMAFNYFFTTLWVIGIMNSINMLDNMDGIATIVSISTIVGALALILFQEDYGNVYIIILVGMLATLIGFLFFNWYPSKMYMGDTGSQFLGVFLATISIVFFWQFRDEAGSVIQLRQFIIPLIIFIIPFSDTFTVVIRRIARQQSPFIGGKDHITHYLGYLGLPDNMIAIVIGFISFVSVGLMWVILIKFEDWRTWYSFLVIGYFLIIFFLINYYYEKAKRLQKDQ